MPRPKMSAMADEVRLNGRDAANIGQYLTSLANLIDPELGPPYAAFQLSEQQRRLLADGRAIGDRPGQLAELLSLDPPVQ